MIDAVSSAAIQIRKSAKLSKLLSVRKKEQEKLSYDDVIQMSVLMSICVNLCHFDELLNYFFVSFHIKLPSFYSIFLHF